MNESLTVYLSWTVNETWQVNGRWKLMKVGEWIESWTVHESQTANEK